MNYYTVKNVDDLLEMQDVLEEEYEEYKLQWMLDHGFTLKDLLNDLVEIADAYEYGNIQHDLHECFESWENENGFPGHSIWASYEEWLDNEIKLYELRVFVSGRKIKTGRCLVDVDGNILAIINISPEIECQCEKNKDFELECYDSRNGMFYECKCLGLEQWKVVIENE